MKRILLALLCLLPCAGCPTLLVVDPVTGDTTLNLELTHQRLTPIIASTGTWAAAFDAAGEEDTAEAMRAFSRALTAIDAVIVSGIGSDDPVDLRSVLQLAVNNLDELAAIVLEDNERQAEYLVWVSIAQLLLGQLAASV